MQILENVRSFFVLLQAAAAASFFPNYIMAAQQVAVAAQLVTVAAQQVAVATPQQQWRYRAACPRLWVEEQRPDAACG